MSEYSFLLFAEPSFFEGMARIFDFGNTLNQYNKTQAADFVAISSDWHAVGVDMKRAANNITVEAKPKQKSRKRREHASEQR